MFVNKALHNQAPEYIKDMLISYQSQRHLRSSQNMLLTFSTALFLLRLLLSGIYYVIHKISVKHGHFKKGLEDLSILSRFWRLIGLENCEGLALLCLIVILCLYEF